MPLTTTEARLIGLERRQKELEALLAQALAQIADLKARTQQQGVQMAGLFPGMVRHAKTRSGGIAAATATQMTSATVDIWHSDGAGLLTIATGETATAWNKSTGAVAATTHVLIGRVDGLDVVVWEMCP